jgi:hypothetical protein
MELNKQLSFGCESNIQFSTAIIFQFDRILAKPRC